MFDVFYSWQLCFCMFGFFTWIRFTVNHVELEDGVNVYYARFIWYLLFQVNEDAHRNGFAADFQAKVKLGCTGVGMTPYVSNISTSYIDTASDELSDTSDDSDIGVHWTHWSWWTFMCVNAVDPHQWFMQDTGLVMYNWVIYHSDRRSCGHCLV